MRLRLVLTSSLTAALLMGTASPGVSAPLGMRESGHGTANIKTQDCPVNLCYTFDVPANGTPIKDGRFFGILRVVNDGFGDENGRTCRPAAGDATFKKGNNRIRIKFEGLWCWTDIPDAYEPVVVKALYAITDGTGNFNHAKGRGGLSMNLVFTDSSDFKYRADGTY